jgi:hypothetical protein
MHGAINQLAPDIQEERCNLRATRRKPENNEKRRLPIAAMLRWTDQRAAWRELTSVEDKA